MRVQLIDFHTHAFPDAIAQRAMSKLAHDGGGLMPRADGTALALNRALSEAGALGVLLPVATNPLKLASMNRWALAQRSERLIPFGAMHPFAPDAVEQLDELVAKGVKGVKLHPQYQGYAVDDPRARALYRQIARRGLITVFHAGEDVAYMPPCACEPEALSRVIGDFDGAPVVAAHMGGYLLWERALAALSPLPVLIDTSYACGRILRPLAMRMVEAFTPERVLYGTDLPWAGEEETLRMIDSWDLSAEDRAAILYGNARRLLGLEEERSSPYV